MGPGYNQGKRAPLGSWAEIGWWSADLDPSLGLQISLLQSLIKGNS